MIGSDYYAITGVRLHCPITLPVTALQINWSKITASFTFKRKL